MLYDMADAMEQAAKLGIHHRDIKDRNILISNGSYHFSDFGDSKLTVVSKKRGAESLLNSVNFMAPEVFHWYKQKLDQIDYDLEKSDVFSLGLVFLKIAKLGVMNYTDQSSLFKEISSLSNAYDTFGDILKKMLAFDPERRPTWESLKKYLLLYWPNLKAHSLKEDKLTNERTIANMVPVKVDIEDFVNLENLAKGYLQLGCYEEALKTYLEAYELFHLYHRGD